MQTFVSIAKAANTIAFAIHLAYTLTRAGDLKELALINHAELRAKKAHCNATGLLLSEN